MKGQNGCSKARFVNLIQHYSVLNVVVIHCFHLLPYKFIYFLEGGGFLGIGNTSCTRQEHSGFLYAGF